MAHPCDSLYGLKACTCRKLVTLCSESTEACSPRWTVSALPDSCLQPFAGLLPHTVMQPGRVVGAMTRQAAEQFGLRKDCLVCAGTSGEGSCEGQTCLLASTT